MKLDVVYFLLNRNEMSGCFELGLWVDVVEYACWYVRVVGLGVLWNVFAF